MKLDKEQLELLHQRMCERALIILFNGRDNSDEEHLPIEEILVENINTIIRVQAALIEAGLFDPKAPSIPALIIPSNHLKCPEEFQIVGIHKDTGETVTRDQIRAEEVSPNDVILTGEYQTIKAGMLNPNTLRNKYNAEVNPPLTESPLGNGKTFLKEG